MPRIDGQPWIGYSPTPGAAGSTCLWPGRLDRLGRDLKHLIMMLDELAAIGIAFTSLNEGIDTTTPAGRLQLHLLGAIAQFERDRIRERVNAGLQRAKAQGKRLGRPRRQPSAITVPGGTVRAAAAAWGVSKSTAARWINEGRQHESVASGECPV